MNRERNYVVDVARAASVVVVVFFHGLLYEVRLVDHTLKVTPWSAPTYLYPLTWVLMVMPLFFIAGGFGHARTIDRMRRSGASYGHFLASRGRRIVGPLVVFLSASTVLATVGAWAGWVDVAITLSHQLMQLLWFIAVYLVIIAIAPLMVTLHDRWGAWPMLALGVAALAVDAWALRAGEPLIRSLNLLTVWPLVHQLGIAYERGWFRRGPGWTPWVSVFLGAATVAYLVFVAGYPATSVGFPDIPYANVQPPSFAMVALAIAQCGVMGLVDRSGALATMSARAQVVLGTVNALLVTTYLWHIACIVLADLGLVGLAMLAPVAAPVLLNQLVVAVAGLVVVVLAVPPLARLEQRLVPALGHDQDPVHALAAFGLLTAGTIGVWQFGTVLHPAAPWSIVSLTAVALGAMLMRGAADSKRRGWWMAQWRRRAS